MKRMWSRNELNNKINEQLASGNVPSAKIFEGIKDSQGHDRFIEGDITIAETTGTTETYGKWSLSGSHLMIVLAGTMEAMAHTYAYLVNDINLPQWVKDKIMRVREASDLVVYGNFSLWDDDSNVSSQYAQLRKLNDGRIAITRSAVTLTTEKSFRYNFDLLIDNE